MIKTGPLPVISPNFTNMHIKQQGHIGVAEHRPLLISLTEETDYFGEAGLRPSHLALGLVDVLGCDQVENDRYQSSVLDSFVPRRRIVDRDSRPENLPRFEAAPGWMEAFVELVDLVGKESTDRESGNKDAAERKQGRS